MIVLFLASFRKNTFNTLYIFNTFHTYNLKCKQLFQGKKLSHLWAL